MLTKVQTEIMKVFVSRITEKFSIKQISEILNKPYPLIHRSIKILIDEKFILKDSKLLLELNYKKNQAILSYIESLRSLELISKNKTLELFKNDLLDNIKEDFFIFLIFGSFIKSKNYNDIDVLFILKDSQIIEKLDKQIKNITSNYSLKLDINVISIESAYEMLSKRDKINILNESLNNHIILFGAENFYRILKNAR